MEQLKDFIKKISGFSDFAAAKQIKYFVYYLQQIAEKESISGKDVNNCFDELHLNRYSNTPQYLTNRSKKGATQEFLKTKTGYILFGKTKHEIEQELNLTIEVKATNSLYPLAIFEKTPTYLTAFAEEAAICYDHHLYNSCLFMLRKICEILIIELFESKGIEASIRNPKGDYFQLADLIKAAVSETSWKLSKIVRENLPKIKLLADSSVHSKRFKARKPDIDPMKTDLRIVFEELLTLIDYPIKKH